MSNSTTTGKPGLPAIDGFEIVREVHHCEFAALYQAVRQSDKKPVVIQVGMGELAEPAAQARFLRDNQLLGALHEPHLFDAVETGTSGDQPYCAVAVNAGQPLEAYAAEKQDWTIEEVVELMSKISSALHAAHLHGVIHRHLTADHIIVDKQGEPHILGFGLPDPKTGATSAWSSPEQIAQTPTGAPDLRSDIYSLGLVLYRLLVDRFPYNVDGDPKAVAEEILNAKPVPLSSLDEQIDRPLETIVSISLAKDPAARYQSAAELASDFDRYLKGKPVGLVGGGAEYRFGTALRRFWPLTALTVIVILALGFTALALQSTYTREREARKAADRQARGTRARLDLLFNTTAKAMARDAARTLAVQPNGEELSHVFLVKTYHAIALYAQALRDEKGSEDDPRTQSDLADAYTFMGELAEAAGATEDAIKRYQNALGIRQALAKASPNDPKIQTALAICHDHLGDLARASDDAAGALSHYRKALGIRRDMLTGNKTPNPQVLRQLMEAAMDLGALHEQLENVDGAIHAYRQADAAGRTLLAGAQGVFGEQAMVQIQERVATVMERTAALLNQKGNTVAARSAAKGAVSARRGLAERPGATADDLNSLAWVLLTIEPKGVRDPGAAVQVARKAVESTGGEVAYILDTLALAYRAQGENLKAAETQQRALEALSADSPSRPEYQARLDEYRAAATTQPTSQAASRPTTQAAAP